MKNIHVILESNQKQFDFSKTKLEKEATKRAISMHNQSLRKFYGNAIFDTYRNQIFNTNPVLREELIAKYKLRLLKKAKESGKRIFTVKAA